jgi:hypothetical protein
MILIWLAINFHWKAARPDTILFVRQTLQGVTSRLSAATLFTRYIAQLFPMAYNRPNCRMAKCCPGHPGIIATTPPRLGSMPRNRSVTWEHRWGSSTRAARNNPRRVPSMKNSHLSSSAYLQSYCTIYHPNSIPTCLRINQTLVTLQ